MKKTQKQFWKSKTFWFNVLLIIGGLSTAAIESIQAGTSITLAGIFNMILRVISNKEIIWEL